MKIEILKNKIQNNINEESEGALIVFLSSPGDSNLQIPTISNLIYISSSCPQII